MQAPSSYLSTRDNHWLILTRNCEHFDIQIFSVLLVIFSSFAVEKIQHYSKSRIQNDFNVVVVLIEVVGFGSECNGRMDSKIYHLIVSFFETKTDFEYRNKSQTNQKVNFRWTFDSTLNNTGALFIRNLLDRIVDRIQFVCRKRSTMPNSLICSMLFEIFRFNVLMLIDTFHWIFESYFYVCCFRYF